MMELCELLELGIKEKAADLHLQEGRPPLLRVENRLQELPLPDLEKAEIYRLLAETGWAENSESPDYAFSWGEGFRCRLHVCREYAGLHAIIRFLYPLSLLPPDDDAYFLARLSTLRDGLVLFCGPTGSGKTTALWRILQLINQTRSCHIITLEDPIEYVEKGEKALITQRELGEHFTAFAEGIRQSLREDPDVILVGEMRDRETMDAALTAAETGALVLATLHSRSASQAVSRIVGVYHGEEQSEIRCRLALVLQAVLAQRRLQQKGSVRIAREILVQTPAVAQLIRSGKEHQLETVIQTGAALGMRTMEQALQQLKGPSDYAAAGAW